MDVGKVLKPGDKGTKRLQQVYGDKLICVRYRYDKKQRKRLTTAEIIIEEKSWVHSPRFNPEQASGKNEFVLIRVFFSEEDIRGKIKSHGGRWKPEQKAWALDYQTVEKLGLQHRIIGYDNID